MDRSPVRTAVRKLGRQSRFGEGPKVCFRCGYGDPVSLMAVTKDWIESHKNILPRSLFEKDHLIGRNHDAHLVFPICRNCHGEVTELRWQAGIRMEFEPSRKEREILRLEALAFLHEDTALALRRWAAEKKGNAK